MARRGHERVDCEGGGGPHDRSHVVRVGDLVEHQDQPAAILNFREVDRVERCGFEQDTLVNGLGAKLPREIIRRDEMRDETGRRDFGR